MYRRVLFLYCTVLVCFSLLVLRLFVLSEGNKSKEVLDGQYTRKLDIVSHSGFIYDRNLELLSHEKNGAVLLAVPSRIKANYTELSKQISTASVNADENRVYGLLSEKMPFKLMCTPNNELTALSGKDGIFVFENYEETNSIAKHILGYKDVDKKGVSGLRKQYSDALKSFDYNLYAEYEADASGAIMSDGYFTLYSDGENGKNGLVTTIDKDIQEFCDALYGTYIESGAVVVTDINTGEILALSSYPEFDADNIYKSLSSDKGELLNRAFCTFTPGSVFKLVVAAAALEKDQNLIDFEYECTGKTDVDGSIFHCHDKNGHKNQTLCTAFANSCNTYFIELGNKIGLESIVDMCKKLGLGQGQNIDGLESTASSIPEGTEKSKTFAANISFGQGTLLVSPVDMARVVSACATGKLENLSIIKGTFDSKEIKAFKKQQGTQVLSQSTVEHLRQMMRMCVQEGTGKKAYVKTVNTGGKTATAQTGSYHNDGTEKLHLWFCGIIGTNSPKYCIIVFCDGNSRNNKHPAEIFKIISEKITNSSR